MPKYVKVRGGAAVQYPITEADLSNATGLNYPNGATEKDFRNYGCYPVYPVQPDTTQDLVEELLPVQGDDGYWYESWDAREFTVPELESYKVKKQEESREYRKEYETTQNPTYDTSRDARVLLNEVYIDSKANPTKTLYLPTKVGILTGDLTVIEPFYQDVIQWVEDCLQAEVTTFTLISGAVSKAAVDAVDITAGYPT